MTSEKLTREQRKRLNERLATARSTLTDALHTTRNNMKEPARVKAARKIGASIRRADTCRTSSQAYSDSR